MLRLIVVALQRDRVNRHLSLDVHELNPMEGDAVLEHAVMNVVDGDLKCGSLGQDQDVEELSRMHGHSAVALLVAPHLVHHMIADDTVLSGAHTQMQGDVIAGPYHAARLEVYHESRIGGITSTVISLSHICWLDIIVKFTSLRIHSK